MSLVFQLSVVVKELVNASIPALKVLGPTWLTTHPQGRSLIINSGLGSEKLPFGAANLDKFIRISIYKLISSNPKYGQFLLLFILTPVYSSIPFISFPVFL